MVTATEACYLKHFRLREQPFTLTPNTDFFCSLSSHQETLNVLLVGLYNGEGFLKVVGEVGTGKTLLCRTLLHHLKSTFYTTYILNPNTPPLGFYYALAHELGIDVQAHHAQHTIQQAITNRLLALNASDKPVVLIIDEAQTMPIETLEAVRLLTNLETESKKLIQIVLFGQPELDTLLSRNDLRQLKQRITFEHALIIVTTQELETYIQHRLKVAGYQYGELFSKKAYKNLYKASGGIPRIINILSHKALLSAYGRNQPQVSHKHMDYAIKDSKHIVSHKYSMEFFLKLLIGLSGIGIVAMIALLFKQTLEGLL